LTLIGDLSNRLSSVIGSSAWRSSVAVELRSYRATLDVTL
jgi:hypothetical protein